MTKAEDFAEQLTQASTRKRLASSDFARRDAVCMFPLRVMSMADTMRQLLEASKYREKSDQLEAGLDYLEQHIRAEYRKTFGVEMG